MPEPSKAVFLSYASQDGAAARRICEVLRAKGIEVWFDADGGLEHGDEWDAKIRRQIRDCVLFIPVISASTEARFEGYFRMEWDLAAERSRGIAAGVPFILPVIIDDTEEADAMVPPRFRTVQWTRLPGGTVPAEVLTRFLKLWAERTGPAGAARPATSAGLSAARFAPAGFATEEKSIVVLPFANLSTEPENEYFSDGMTEEIINALARVPDLRVAARTSAFAFKGKPDDLRTIAGKLNVRHVLEGSVRKAGNTIRITVQLSNAIDGFNLWSERFDRGLEDIFAVQDEIARAIAENLKAKLAPSGRQVLVKPATHDLEAYQLYLRGRFFWNQRGAGLMKGLKCFEAALARDPSYALAYTGIADTYSLLPTYGHVRARDVFPKARDAVHRALLLDPEMPEAHCALAYVHLFFERNFAAAQREFERTIELKPDYAPCYTWKAGLLSALCRHDEAVATHLQAVQLEPLSFQANVCYAWSLNTQGSYEEAIVHAQRVVDLEQRHFLGYWVLGTARIGAGKIDEGLASLQRAVELSHSLPWMVAAFGCGLVVAGRPEEARQLRRELTARAAHEYVAAYAMAMLHAFLGEEAETMTWLEQAIADGDPALVWLRVDTGPLTAMGIPAAYLSAAQRAALAQRLGLYLE